MNSSSLGRLAQRVLVAPAAGALLATTTSEHASAKATTRLVLESKLATRPWMIYHKPLQQQAMLRRFFSDKPPVIVKPTAAAKEAAVANGGGFLQWYEGHLQTRPVATKMITGCFLWGVGDAVAQLVPQVTTTTTPPPTTTTSSLLNQPLVYDWPRTGRACFFGFAIHAPGSHLHFNFLEWLTHRAGVTGLGVPVFKAFMEQFVYWSWISNSAYHGAMGAMQGQDLSQIYQRIADVLWETQKAQWIFWIPIQLLNFQFVSLLLASLFICH